MTFKDILASDVSSIFLNVMEFADLHVVNGVAMPCQIDNNEQIEREKRYAAHMDGIFVNQKLIYVSAADFGALPKTGALLTLDGRKYRVVDAIDEYGIYSISLDGNRA